MIDLGFLKRLLLLLAIVLPASLGRSEIIISEIMYDPQGPDRDSIGSSYTYNREWTELYNTGTSTVDLSGWQFGDAADNNWASPFPIGTTLGAGQALVVTGDAARFDANWGTGINRIEVSAFPNQANSVGDNEAAAIRNAQGVVLDSVRYQDAGWPTADGSDGNSIFLLPQALSSTANDAGSSWLPSSRGLYGARYVAAGGEGENHGSPGFVATTAQAPFLPDANVAWSMAVLPDTQNYSKSTKNYPIFPQITNWIKNNRDQFKIALAMQEGDIVNRNNEDMPASGELPSAQQWTNASNAMGVLDGVVPYIMAVGNHDLGTGDGTAQNRLTEFNTYFPPSRNPLNDPLQGGILKGVFEPDHYENAYYELHAPDGRNLLVFSLEFWPTDAMVAWADRIASQPKYADYSAVLITHSYLSPNNQRANASPSTYPIGASLDYNDGEQLWQKLVSQNGNFEMTFSGHVGGDGVAYLQSTGVDGNKVHQMMINAQFETNGGNGWFRLLEVLDDGKTVHVRTYSPFFNLYRTDPTNDFYITLTPLPMTPGDFNADGLVDSADLSIWQAFAGKATGASRIEGDADRDGDVDGADYLLWQRNRGGAAAISAANQAAPEPATIQCMVVGAVVLAARLRRRGFLESAAS
jgi:hypothetical protein